MEVFLGGTCNNSQWREILKPMLNIGYFDPVVKDWNDEAAKLELEKRKTCDYVLYTITSSMTGVYSIAEVVDDSNKRPEKTILCLPEYDWLLYFDEIVKTPHTFEKHQYKSLQAVAKMVINNGAKFFSTLEEVADYFNFMKKIY